MKLGRAPTTIIIGFTKIQKGLSQIQGQKSVVFLPPEAMPKVKEEMLFSIQGRKLHICVLPEAMPKVEK